MGLTLFASKTQPPMRQQLFSNLQRQHTIVKRGSEDKYRIHLKLQEGIGVGRIKVLVLNFSQNTPNSIPMLTERAIGFKIPNPSLVVYLQLTLTALTF